MKKTYISPATIVANIDVEQLICQSYGLFSTSATQGDDLANDRDSSDDEDDLW